MKTRQAAKLSTEDRFLYWIKERESIRLKRKAGKQKPWTDDEILQSWRFCNVRRMDDTVSQWLLKNWYEPFFEHPNMLLACFMGRIFNNPDTLTELGFPEKWDAKKTLKVLLRRKQAGLKNFNAAYIVSTNGLEGCKAEILVKRLLMPASKLKITQTTSLRALSDDLRRLWGISSFMGGQITADVRWGCNGPWLDRKLWAPVGPGSRRGINRLFQRDIKFPVDQRKFIEEFVEVRGMVKASLPKIYKRVEAIDIQNCLCEFDKYERILHGEGRAKQKYGGT